MPGLGRGRRSSCVTGLIMYEIAVRAVEPPRRRATEGGLWPVRKAWNRATENLYSAWIEKLFDAPLDAEPSWPPLHVLLRDRSRNFLFNHLGLGEDQMGLIIRPDCADLPYFLRAHFAFKMSLPFGYSKCSRGVSGQPPKCFAWWNIQNLEPANPLNCETAGDHPGTRRTSVGIQRPADAKRLGLAASFGQYLQRPVAAVTFRIRGRIL
jgi:hypothetical protein